MFTRLQRRLFSQRTLRRDLATVTLPTIARPDLPDAFTLHSCIKDLATKYVQPVDAIKVSSHKWNEHHQTAFREFLPNLIRTQADDEPLTVDIRAFSGFQSSKSWIAPGYSPTWNPEEHDAEHDRPTLAERCPGALTTDVLLHDLEDFANRVLLTPKQPVWGPRTIRFVTDDDLARNLAHVGLPSSVLTSMFRCWEHRIFWINDSSHHFAAVYRQCRDQGRSLPIRIKRTWEWLDPAIVARLTAAWTLAVVQRTTVAAKQGALSACLRAANLPYTAWLIGERAELETDHHPPEAENIHARALLVISRDHPVSTTVAAWGARQGPDHWFDLGHALHAALAVQCTPWQRTDAPGTWEVPTAARAA